MQSVVRRAVIAAASTLVAVTGLGPASPALAGEVYGNLMISGVPKRITVPKVATDLPFVVTFSGPAKEPMKVDYGPHNHRVGEDYVYASTTALRTNRVTAVAAPGVRFPWTPAPNTPLAYTLKLSPDRTPGHYRLTIPMEQYKLIANNSWEHNDISASVEFDLIANPAVTIATSNLTGSGRFSRTARWTWRFAGPQYVRGATIKVYFRANGSKTYVKVASAKLNAAGDAKFTGKKGAIRTKGRVYYVLGKVSFSPSSKSAVVALKKSPLVLKAT